MATHDTPNTGPIVDADGHVLEPLDTWQKYIDPQYRDRAVRLEHDDNGWEVLMFDNKPSFSTVSTLSMNREPKRCERSGLLAVTLPARREMRIMKAAVPLDVFCTTLYVVNLMHCSMCWTMTGMSRQHSTPQTSKLRSTNRTKPNNLAFWGCRRLAFRTCLRLRVPAVRRS